MQGPQLRPRSSFHFLFHDSFPNEKYPKKIWGVDTSKMTPDWAPNRIKFRVQISDTSNKVGIPEVGRMVKRTLVRFVRIFF